MSELKTLTPADVSPLSCINLNEDSAFVVGVREGKGVVLKSQHNTEAAARAVCKKTRRVMRSTDPEVYRVEREAGHASTPR